MPSDTVIHFRRFYRYIYLVFEDIERESHFGEAYRDYAKRVPCLFPNCPPDAGRPGAGRRSDRSPRRIARHLPEEER